VVNAIKPDGSTAPSEVRAQVLSIREKEPAASVIVLLDEANPRAVRAAREAGASDFIGPAVAGNTVALEWRISTAMKRAPARWRGGTRVGVEQRPKSFRHTTERQEPTPGLTRGAPVEPTADDVAKALVNVEAGLKRIPTPKQALARAAKLTTIVTPELRSEESGRFDANKIAARLGVSVNRLAPSTGVSQQALSKRPDSPRAQKALASAARVLAALDELHLVNEARMWLQTPHPRLGDEPPLELILRGEADIVARMLERALEGVAD
jgi:hypothetical protein